MVHGLKWLKSIWTRLAIGFQGHLERGEQVCYSSQFPPHTGQEAGTQAFPPRTGQEAGTQAFPPRTGQEAGTQAFTSEERRVGKAIAYASRTRGEPCHKEGGGGPPGDPPPGPCGEGTRGAQPPGQ